LFKIITKKNEKYIYINSSNKDTKKKFIFVFLDVKRKFAHDLYIKSLKPIASFLKNIYIYLLKLHTKIIKLFFLYIYLVNITRLHQSILYYILYNNKI